MDHQENFLDKDSMLNIFGEAREQLPPFDEFLTCKYEEKQQRCTKGLGNNVSHIKVVPYKLLIDKLFDLQDETNKQTNDYMSGIIPRMLNTFIKELHDPKKSTLSHLSSQDRALSWINSIEEEIQNGIGVHVANNPCKSSFGVLTDELKSYENLRLTYTGRIALCKKNGDFASGFRKVGKDGKFKFIITIFTLMLL